MKQNTSTTTPRTGFKKKEGPTEVDIHVGHRLRERRILLGLTQESIAASTGLTFQQIQKYEQGKNRISASRLLQLSKLLKVDPNFFFLNMLSGKPSLSRGLAEDQETFDSGNTVDFKEITKIMRSLNNVQDPKARKNILKLFKQMVKNASN